MSEKQRRQTSLSAKTLRAARLLAVAGVGSTLAARSGDARVSPPWPPPKSTAAEPLSILKQALTLAALERANDPAWREPVAAFRHECGVGSPSSHPGSRAAAGPADTAALRRKPVTCKGCHEMSGRLFPAVAVLPFELGSANMGRHIMKTTIEIADDLFARVQQVARKEKTTFRALTERGLRIVLREKQVKPAKWKWKPVTFQGDGLTDEFKDASWQKIRDEIYRGHGA